MIGRYQYLRAPAVVTATSPFTFATGDQIRVSGSYEL